MGREDSTAESIDAGTPPTLAALADDDSPAFHAPWQARAFAVAVALSEDGAYDWEAFRERLADEVDRSAAPDVPSDADASEAVYYRRWLAALERLLVEDALLDPDELSERAAAFADGDRDASEWVEGEREHDHGDHAHPRRVRKGYSAEPEKDR